MRRTSGSKLAHVVVGSSGQYDDYREWLVAAFEGGGAAERHAKLATDEAGRVTQRIQRWWDKHSDPDDPTPIPKSWDRKGASVHDPGQTAHGLYEATYRVESIPFHRAASRAAGRAE